MGEGELRAKIAPVLGAAAKAYVESWTSVASDLGGVGFFEYDDRRFVVSELIESELESERGVEGALEVLLCFDRCRSTVRTLASKRMDARLAHGLSLSLIHI